MKFPVWRTAVEVFEFLWRERRLLLRHGTMPFLVSLAAFVVAQAMGLNLTQPQPQDFPKALPFALVELVIFLPMTVTWYRLSVLGESEGEQRPLFTLGRLEGRFLLWQILLGLAVGGIAAVPLSILGVAYYIADSMGFGRPAVVICGILGVGVVIGTIIALARLSLVLVLAALGRPVNFKGSWRMTQGLGWRIFGILVLITLAVVVFNLLFSLIAFIVGGITATIAGRELDDVLRYFRQVGHSLSSVLTAAAFATVMGFIYRFLLPHAAMAGEPPTASPVNSGPVNNGT